MLITDLLKFGKQRLTYESFSITLWFGSTFLHFVMCHAHYWLPTEMMIYGWSNPTVFTIYYYSGYTTYIPCIAYLTSYSTCRNLNHVYATPSGSGSCGDIFNDIWVKWHNVIWCGEPEIWWRMSSYWWITVYWAGLPLRWDGLWVKVTCNPSNGSLGPDSDPTSSSCHGLELQPKSFWVKLLHVCAKRNFG